jgi:uncharacterized protein YecA (UPF0149 family)
LDLVGIDGRRLIAELEKVPTDVLPADEREFAAFAWAMGAAQRGYKTIEEILGDRQLKAQILDDFDDEDADRQLAQTQTTHYAPSPSGATIPGSKAINYEWLQAPPKLGRNDPCSCGSGKKYKKCCLG